MTRFFKIYHIVSVSFISLFHSTLGRAPPQPSTDLLINLISLINKLLKLSPIIIKKIRYINSKIVYYIIINKGIESYH